MFKPFIYCICECFSRYLLCSNNQYNEESYAYIDTNTFRDTRWLIRTRKSDRHYKHQHNFVLKLAVHKAMYRKLNVQQHETH